MFLSRAVNYLTLTWHIKKLTIATALQYRLSFVVQLLGTFIIDSAFLILWIIFFTKFHTIKGWTFEDTALLLAIGWCSYALNALCMGGIFKLAHIIVTGGIDYYLLLPHNMLWHISVSQTDLSSLGNLMAMVIMFILSGAITIKKIMLFACMSCISAGVFYNFMVITQSLAFYFGSFELVAQQLMLALISFIYYPPVIFSGILKYITLFIIPAYFVGFLPAQLVQNFDSTLFLILLGFWFITGVIAVILFNEGLKRYESGSLIQIRT